jgi:hypothetical protein
VQIIAARQSSCDQRIGRDGRAVREQCHIGQIDVFLREPREQAVDGVFGARCLGDPHDTCSFVEEAEVSESAANVDGYTQAHVAHPLRSHASLGQMTPRLHS